MFITVCSFILATLLLIIALAAIIASEGDGGTFVIGIILLFASVILFINVASYDSDSDDENHPPVESTIDKCDCKCYCAEEEPR